MTEFVASSRRNVLVGAGKTLTIAGLGAFIGACASEVARSEAQAQPTGQDVEILNAAIALEHEGIAAYTIAAGSGLLQPAVVQVGVTFRGHHMAHRDALMGAVRSLGGTPAEPRSEADYIEALGVASLRDQADVLRLALRLERGAANAYLSLIPSLGVDYHQVAARMAGDEAFHVAILANALGEPIPAEGLMFGG